MILLFILLRLTKTRLTFINRTRLRTEGQNAGYSQAPRKKKLVAFGADEPDSSEPVKGLKEGVFQM